MEWRLYNTFNDPDLPEFSMTNDTSFEYDSNDYVNIGKIKTIGIAGNTKRGIEIYFSSP
jgi:hypothetical protein